MTSVALSKPEHQRGGVPSPWGELPADVHHITLTLSPCDRPEYGGHPSSPRLVSRLVKGKEATASKSKEATASKKEGRRGR